MSRPALPHTAAGWHPRVWTLAWPVILANASVPLVGMVDTAVVGHLPGPHYIGAVAIGAVAFNFLQWLCSFLRMGTTGFVAQAFGAGNTLEIGAVAARACMLAGLFGVLAMLAAPLLVALAFLVVDGSADVEALGREYLSIRLWSAPAALANLALLGVLFGIQRMRAALAVQLTLNVANVVLDLSFVVGLGWGVAGVAWASVAAEWLAATLAAWLTLRALRSLGVPARGLDLWHRGRLRGLLLVNVNIFLRTLAVQVTFFYFTAAGARQGDVVLAANAVLLHLFHLLAYALDGFAFALEALAGSAYGARDPKALRAVVLSATAWSLVVAGLFSACFAAAGMQLVTLMTSVAAVVTECGRYLPWVVVAPLVSVWSYLLDGVYFGTTRTREMRNSMGIAMLVYFACVTVAVPALGNHGLWLSVMVFMIVRAVTLGAWYPRIERALRG